MVELDGLKVFSNLNDSETLAFENYFTLSNSL